MKRTGVGGLLTVLDIADLDLLQDLGPDGGVDLLVAVDELGLEAHDLGDAAARVPLPRRVLLRQAHGLPPRRNGSRGRGRLLCLLRGRRWGPQLAHGGGGGGGGQGSYVHERRGGYLIVRQRAVR